MSEIVHVVVEMAIRLDDDEEIDADELETDFRVKGGEWGTVTRFELTHDGEEEEDDEESELQGMPEAGSGAVSSPRRQAPVRRERTLPRLD